VQKKNLGGVLMRFFRIQSAVLAVSLLAAAAFFVSTSIPVAHTQTITTGALSGVVADSTGAIVPGATVTVTDLSTNAKQVVVTNAEGRYTVSQLRPGQYKVTAVAKNLKSDTIQVTVLLGTTLTANVEVTPTGNVTIIEVSSSALPLVDTQNVALATTLNTEQIQDLPTPGGDVSTVAFTTPGIAVNAGGSYGNFSSDGLPGISNLFVLNGFDNQDPFLNLNNSGSSNLTLGQGELADATVIQNAYNSQYGRAAGAIVSYTTKSGGNAFHGEAMYDYNGTVLNANGWFNNYTATPRPHAVSNEWALNGGGPIVRNKLFFFSDWEGLHYVLPASGYVSLPTAQYQKYAIASAPAAATSTMTTMMNLYKNSPGYASATATAVNASSDGGCGGLDGTPTGSGYFGAYPTGVTSGTLYGCTMSSFASANNINIEWLFTQRVDWVINDKHRIYGRFKMDHGSQPTSTSFINPAFNAKSIQPEYEGQFNDSYTFSPNVINTAVVAANWYTAFFGFSNPAAAAAALPFYGYFDIGADGSGTAEVPGLTNLGAPFYFPQGRNVTQYQLEDDVSWTKGPHSFKFGVNFRRDLIEDFDQQEETVDPLLVFFSLNDIAQGQICGTNSQWCGYNEFQQAFITSADAHLALYNIGIYAQDDWAVTNKLKLTIGARIDRTGNPLCHSNCFSLFNGNFPGSGTSLTTPYASLINSANAHAYTVDPFYFQPRFGFNYQLDQKTVVRGGFGLFADLYPATFMDGPIQNFPNYNVETVYGGNVTTSGAGSMYADATSANKAVQTGFKSGNATTINSALYAQGVPFAPPSLNAYFPGTLHEATYIEYSVQIQRQLTKDDGLSLTFAANHGYHEIMQNPFANASSGIFSSAVTPSATASWVSNGSIAGLGATPPNPSFGEVNEFTNNSKSNYDGGSIEYTHIGNGITGHLAYTYSHSLDDISNGGVGEYYNTESITKQLTPTLGAGNLNYSNSDYDIRNQMVGDLIYAVPLKAQNWLLNYAISGWTLGAKTYYRSGIPFSIVNNNAISGFPTMASINNTLGLTSLMPQVSTFSLTNTCSMNPHNAVSGSCLDATQYSTSAGFGNLRRNYLYGPHYADTDATLTKKFFQKEQFAFELGAQAYNLINHPNFSTPGNTVGTGSFGLISAVEAPPTSPYGSFQSAAVTQRVLVVTGRISF
jgi:hypothetical protein